MVIRIKSEGVLESKADALILTFDGENPAFRQGADFVTGNLANAFRRRWPDAWEQVEEAIGASDELVPCGEVLTVPLPDEVSPFKGLVLTSTLRHHGDRSVGTMKDIVTSALRDATVNAANAGWNSLATTVMSGGPRLSTQLAFMAMLEGYRAAVKDLKRDVPDVQICETVPERFAVISGIWRRILN